MSLSTLLAIHFLCGVALADPDSPGAPPFDVGTTDAPPEVSAEELSAIAAALAADAASAHADVPVATVPPRGGGSVQSANPDIAFIADIALAAFTSDEVLQTGAHDPKVNGFNLQQLELSISKPVDPYFHFDSNIVFSEFGVEIEEVYATTLGLPGRMQFRVGQFLTQFGRVNGTHPHAWDFVDQPFPLGRVFGGEANRGLGVEGSWLVPVPWYLELIVSETMLGGEATNRSWADFAALGVEGPLDFQTTIAGKQFFSMGPDLSLMWGLSWAVGPNGTGRTNRSEVYGTDLYLKYRPISEASQTTVALHSEWFLRRRQVPEDVVSDLNGFSQLTWRFTRRWGAGTRYEIGTPELGIDGTQAATALDPQWTSTRHRVGTALTYWPTEFSRLRLQGARDLADWIVTPAWSAFLAFEFNAGAHGAHAF